MSRMSQWSVSVGLFATVVAVGCSSTDGCKSCRGQAPVARALPVREAVTGLRYGGQKTCPVTGEDLGSMGEPVSVTVNGRTIFVCCPGCAAKAQADPKNMLAKVDSERALN